LEEKDQESQKIGVVKKASELKNFGSSSSNPQDLKLIYNTTNFLLLTDEQGKIKFISAQVSQDNFWEIRRKIVIDISYLNLEYESIYFSYSNFVLIKHESHKYSLFVFEGDYWGNWKYSLKKNFYMEFDIEDIRSISSYDAPPGSLMIKTFNSGEFYLTFDQLSPVGYFVDESLSDVDVAFGNEGTQENVNVNIEYDTGDVAQALIA
jgi:hypothetical protein